MNPFHSVHAMIKNYDRSIFKLFFALLIFNTDVRAQVICIYCFIQNDSISTGITNLIQNGGFENHNCTPSYGVIGSPTSFCPNSGGYSCDITGWTCTGGGQDTYACMYDLIINKSFIPEDSNAVYLGNYFANACSNTPGDTSCLVSNGCTLGGFPGGYPQNPDAAFGGALGVSIEQTVTGLIPLNTYVLEFWTGGEMLYTGSGLFAVNVGFGDTILPMHSTSPVGGIGIRYIVEFRATSSSHTIKFTNWGHICQDCTELVLDDVRLYTLAELNPVVPPCISAVPVAAFSGPNHVCPGTCIDFTNLSANGTSFVWNFPGAIPAISTDPNQTGICYNSPGQYPVTLVASNASGSDTLTLNNYVTVYAYPLPQGIMQSGDSLIANAGAASYQWLLDGVTIPGATEYIYVASTGGDYNVVATDTNGCEVEAVIYDVVTSVSNVIEGNGITLYPNPGKEWITLSGLPDGLKNISVYNELGEIVFRSVESGESQKVYCKEFAPGSYTIEIIVYDKVFRKQFMKE